LAGDDTHAGRRSIEMPEFGLNFPVGALYRGTPLDPLSHGMQ
jgi:hypothetical protein